MNVKAGPSSTKERNSSKPVDIGRVRPAPLVGGARSSSRRTVVEQAEEVHGDSTEAGREQRGRLFRPQRVAKAITISRRTGALRTWSALAEASLAGEPLGR